MSEPVGNGPRAPIPGNSHRAREEQAAQPPAQPQERAPVEKVITGNVTIRKKPWYQRFAGRMFATDAHNVGEYVLDNVIFPGLKNLFRNMVVGTIDQAMYGGGIRPNGVAGQVIRGSIVGTNAGPVSSIRDKYPMNDYQSPGQPRRMISREAQATHDFGDIVLETREEVVRVIESLIMRVETYGMASVADMYDMLGTTGSFADRAYGWKNLTDANVRQIPEGWVLDLPKPIPLR